MHAMMQTQKRQGPLQTEAYIHVCGRPSSDSHNTGLTEEAGNCQLSPQQHMHHAKLYSQTQLSMLNMHTTNQYCT